MARNIAAGNKYTFIGFLNDANLFIGGTPTAPAAGTASGAHRVLGIQAAAPVTPDPDTVVIPGDDGSQGEFVFDSIEPRTYIATAGVNDLVLLSYLTNQTLVTLADATSALEDVIDAPDVPVCVIHQSRATFKDANNAGQKAWEVLIIPVAIARYLGRDSFDGRTGANYRISITPQPATRSFAGVTYADQYNAASASYQVFQATNPFHLTAFTGDNSESTFDLDYQPVSAAKSAAWVYTSNNGISTPVTSVSTVNNTITLTNTPTNGQQGAILYQFQG